MAAPDQPLSNCLCTRRLWHRPLSNSNSHRQHGARLDSLALVLDGILRRSVHRGRRKFYYELSSAVGSFRCGADVRPLDPDNSSAGSPRKAGSGQLVGRIHCGSALGRLLDGRADRATGDPSGMTISDFHVSVKGKAANDKKLPDSSGSELFILNNPARFVRR